MIRTFVYGLAVLGVFAVLWPASISFGLPRALSAIALNGGPFLAAATTAFAAPERWVLLGHRW